MSKKHTYKNWWDGKGSLPKAAWVNCHEGNLPVFTIAKSTLWAGGWTRGAWPFPGNAVIDLAGDYAEELPTGNEAARRLFASTLNNNEPVLSLPIADYDVPSWGVGLWLRLALDVRRILEGGKDILVACTGGHGRTGLVVSILAGILVDEAREAPVAWVRAKYCLNAVETREQELYAKRMVRLANEILANKVEA